MKPTILIPGIQGTTLVNANTLDFDTIWSGIQSKYETIYDLALKEDTQYDDMPRAIIERSDVEDLAYKNAFYIIKNMIGGSVYIFGYDWRKSCAENGKRLKEYVDHLKGKLGIDQFNFLTHSMGGIVLSCYLNLLNGNYDIVDHAILTVCPFKGSIHALIGLIKGEGGVKFPFLNSNDEFRKIARTFPSVYELCPTYQGAIDFDTFNSLFGTGLFDIYNSEHWQSNLSQNSLFKVRLKELKRFQEIAIELDLSLLPDETKSRFLIVAGRGEDTRVSVIVEKQGPKEKVNNFFNFDQPKGDGDGTVPLQSSTIYKDDILTLTVESKWHDKATHAFFLNDGRVQAIIKRFLKDETNTTEWWSDAAGSVEEV